MTAERSSPRGWARSPVALLTGFVLLLNLNSMNAFFVGDDFDYLRWFRIGGRVLDAITLQFWGEWEPGWYLTWWIDQMMWGLDPLGFHLHTTLWLAVTVVGLFGFVRAVWPEEPLAAWSVALLFATHPLHDEAVIYLAARGHVLCAAGSVVALWLYALARRHADRRARSALLLSAALVAAALAALSKEIALLLPVWVAVLEWGVLAEPGRRVRRALVAAVWFSSAAGATIALRAAIVGLASGKLTGGIARLPNLLAELGEDLPAYVLLAGLPFPFGFLDRVVLDRFWWLGALLAAAGLLGGVAALIAARRGLRVERMVPGLFLFAMAIISSSLFPVFWAGLNLRRRYLFIPSVGFVLIAALVLHEIGRRRPRCARALLGLLVVIGSLGTVYRNELYRQSGNVARAMIEAVRGTPLDVPLASRNRPRAVLVELPFRYGGDSISGAYLFHHTDFRSALIVYGVPQPTIEFAMRSYFADDREASVTRRDPRTLEIRLRYRTRRAFEDAIRNDPTAKPRGKLVRARRTAVDRDARTLTFELRIDPEFWTTAHRLFLYGNGDLSPVLPLESGAP